MRRLTAVSLAAAFLLALVPVALGLFRGLPWGEGEAASSGLTCTVRPSCEVGELAVFRMSGLSNAHTQTTDFSSYPHVVCCSGPVGLSSACSGSYDTVLTLSAADNAHVASGGYGTQVCLAADAGMDCQHGASCSTGYACLATISDTTNAHVADCDGSLDYGTKVCCAAQAAADTDGDGCADVEEAEQPNDGEQPLLPGETGPYDPLAWYDFYDVPIPVLADPEPNGPRSQAVTLGDALATLNYVGTYENGPANANGVDYDSLKEGDWFDSASQIIAPDGTTDADDAAGRRYDRSPSDEPNPPWGAGPPNGAVTLGDVLVLLNQVGLNCGEEP